MSSGKIITRKTENSLGTRGDFSVSFDHQEFGPYEYMFTRSNLYFNEELQDRGASTFPLRCTQFDNTEIFLERDDIVIAVGQRGSISGNTQNFIDIINLETGKKNRFFTDEVFLIYNEKTTLEVFLMENEKKMHYSLNVNSLKEIAKQEEHISAFFKLLYNWEKKSYESLIFQNTLGKTKDGFFTREKVKQTLADIMRYEPKYFVSKVFTVGSDVGMIDAWESTIYNSIRFSD